ITPLAVHGFLQCTIQRFDRGDDVEGVNDELAALAQLRGVAENLPGLQGDQDEARQHHQGQGAPKARRQIAVDHGSTGPWWAGPYWAATARLVAVRHDCCSLSASGNNPLT